MKTWVLGGAGVLALVFAAACGDDDGGGGPGPIAGSGPSAGSGGQAGGGQEDGGEPAATAAGSGGGGTPGAGGTAGTGAAAGSGTGGGGSGGGSTTTTFQSRPTGIELELDQASKDAGFTFSSASITQKAGGSLIYTEWLSELVNGTDETQCLIAVTADFQDAQGATVTKYDTYAAGPAYDLGVLATSSPCVGPGERVPVWANDLPEVEINISRIKKLVVTLEPIASPNAVVHPMTPALSAITKTYSGDEWELAATATATADIYNVSITFWGKDGAFFVDSEKDYHLENFLEGDTWAIDTAPLGLQTVSLTEVIPHFSFIKGLDGTPRWKLDPQSLRNLERRNEALRLWDAAQARRSRFRASRE